MKAAILRFVACVACVACVAPWGTSAVGNAPPLETDSLKLTPTLGTGSDGSLDASVTAESSGEAL